MIGEKLGRYQILGSLGTGSMGTVYKAEDSSMGSVVAIKVVKSVILYDATKRERFLQGILAAAEIHHPAICPILEIGDQEDDFFVVMPLLEGKTLAQELARKPMPWHDAITLALKIGEGLEAGHAGGAIHRGLKPANIWMKPDGQPVILDFNMARFTEMGEGGSTGPTGKKIDFADTIIPLSALASMSPEQVRGCPVDLRTDVFSFGAILYEMLTGHHPFESRSTLSRMHAILDGIPSAASTLNPEIPRALDAILGKSLAKNPAERYSGLRPLLDELRRVRDQPEPVGAPEHAPVPEATRRSRVGGWILAGIIALVGLALFYFLRF